MAAPSPYCRRWRIAMGLPSWIAIAWAWAGRPQLMGRWDALRLVLQCWVQELRSGHGAYCPCPMEVRS